MPNLDMTGPEGKGPMTGRGMGMGILPEMPVESMVPQEKENKDYLRYYVPLKLEDGEDKEIVQFTEDDLAEIKKQYDEFRYFDKIEAMRKELDYIEADETIDTPRQKKLVLIATYAEIIAGRGKRQTMGPKPVFQLETDEDIPAPMLRAREDRLESVIRKKINYDEIIEFAYKLSGYGACIVKPFFEHEVPPPHKIVVKYNNENLVEFEKKYGKDIALGKGQLYEDWESIKSGEDVFLEDDRNTVTYHGARLRIVEPENFFARLKIKRFEDQPGIHEKLDYTWSDIEARERSGYYDKGSMEKLREYYSKDEKKTEVEKIGFTVWESTIIYKTKADDQAYRQKITYDEQSKILLKSIYFPYNIERPDYEAYCMFPKHNSWFGYTMEEKLAEIVKMCNSLVTSVFNELDISHNQVVMTDDYDFINNASRKTISVNDGDISVLPFTKGSQFRQVTFDHNPQDRMPLLQWALNFSELVSSVSASLMSGHETPNDKSSPYAKSALKYRVSSTRIEDIIINLQKTDSRVAEHIEMIESQFGDEDELKKAKLTAEILEKRVRYVCQGSYMAFDKSSDNESVFMLWDYIKANYPEVAQDLDVRYAVFQVILNNAQGSIERIKDTLIKPMQTLLESRGEMEQMIGELKKQGVPLQVILKQLSGLQSPGMLPAGQGGQGPMPSPNPPESLPQPPMPGLKRPQRPQGQPPMGGPRV